MTHEANSLTVNRIGPVIVATDDEMMLAPGQRFWTEESMFGTDKYGLPYPRFTVAETAKVFFGRGPDWLRMRMKPDTKKVKDPKTQKVLEVIERRFPQGAFILDQDRMVFRRTPSGAHYFTLADIERMGHALAQSDVLPPEQLLNVLSIVKYVGRQHDIFETPELEEDWEASEASWDAF